MAPKMPALVKRHGAPGIWLESAERPVCGVRPGIPPVVAAIFDPPGNAMHTVMAQPVPGKMVRPGGEVALLGIPSNPVTLNLSEAIIAKR